EGEAWDYPACFFQPRIWRIERTPPTTAMIEDAIALICRKQKPLIICGGGVKYSAAGKVLLAFAEQYQIPFAETQAGKGTLLSSHPLNVGGIGETGCLAANTLAKEADLIIGIGTRYTDFTTSSKWLFQHPQVEYLNLNISRFDAFKLDGIDIVADAQAALQLLIQALQPQHYQTAWKEAIKHAKQNYQQEVQRIYQVEYNETDFVPE